MKKIMLIIAILAMTEAKAQKEFWGTTQQGGQFAEGVIFRADSSCNNVKVVRPFVLHQDGSMPQFNNLCHTVSGKFYGMTAQGGEHGLGVLFEYDYTTNTYIKKVDFDTINGGDPYGSLVQASSGKLYGMTLLGGVNNLGVLFEYDPVANIYTKKIDFAGVSNGTNPFGSLIEVSSGKLYGMTPFGGANDMGVLFEYDPVANILVKKIDFIGTSNGANPQFDLIQSTSGKLYGLTAGGGLNNMGVLFEYDVVANTLVKKIDFAGTTNGNFPRSTLVQATNGKLYGSTIYGGTNNKGVLFEYDPTNNQYSKKVDFTGTTNGANPHGKMTESVSNKLYGLTSSGGANNAGTLFEYNILTSTLSKKKDFGSTLFNGKGPVNMINVGVGKLLGLTNNGGSHNVGVLFDYDAILDSCSNKISFGGLQYGNFPVSSLIEASNGKIYGMTPGGGIYSFNSIGGIIFEYDKNNKTFTKSFDFGQDSTVGNRPLGSLVQVGSDKLYGLTSQGGIYNFGALFEYDYVTGIYTTKFSFDSINGRAPSGTLMKSMSGKLYGITNSGGINDNGVLFEYDPVTNTFLKKLDFPIATNGYNPIGNLLESTSGKIYGITLSGGLNNKGVIFEYDPLTNNYFKKFDLSISGGYNISGDLVQVTSGKIYGTTYSGGTNNMGTLFEFDPIATSYNKKLDFDGINFGQKADGGLMLASDGKLYGSTSLGGIYGYGVLFQYDYVNNVYTKKYDFGVILNGRYPVRMRLLEVCATAPPNGLASQTVCSGATLADLNVTGTGLKYYSSSTSTTSLSTTTLLVNNTYYYITQTNGCESDTKFQIFVSVNPSPILSVNNTSICIGSSALVTAIGASNYLWNTGVTTSSISVTPTTTSVYTVTGTDSNSCSNTQTVSVVVDNTCQDVWPGDANSDGLADNLDVLELGLHYTQTGAPRASVSNIWQSYFANNWTSTITNGKNLNHSDCNGDGIVNDNDTLAIYNNYGLTHAFKPAQTNTVNSQLSIVPDQAAVLKGTWGTASIYLGDATTNINNINGLAFTVDFDNTLIEANNIYIEYQNSFIDAGQNLDFRKLDFANGKIYTATTHTVSNNVSGYGKIATLHYQIKSTLVSAQVLNLGISQANQSDVSGTISPLTSGTSSLTATIDVGLKEFLENNTVSISPNPTSGSLTIHSKTELQKIEVVSITGQILLSETPTNVSHTLHLENFSNGIYFVNVYQNNRIVKREKIILNK